jgi:hypothetical protein
VRQGARLEVDVTDSSSEEDTSDRSRDDTGDQDEESGNMDPRESLGSYDFGPSTVTVGRIRQLEALGYFAECSACESGEVVILEPVAGEAVVFEEFFCRRSSDATTPSSDRYFG